ncbi:MAG: hypothetical protein KAI22_09755 [Gammaproteobacteria bacterium]|nr:hypothetical protein [Gammaproteobacteria bacterium]
MTFKTVLFISSGLLFPVVLSAQVITNMDESTKLKSWILVQSGLELQLIQRLPDQTRGFFQGRGFNQQQADDIATQCVLQTIVKNTASKKTKQAISISLKEWRVKVNGQIQSVKLKEDWAKQWAAIEDENLQVKKSAQIAFRWATFPSEQTFEPGGDYNWGMISFALQPGETFDLHVFWQTGSQANDEWIRDIECPKDI